MPESLPDLIENATLAFCGEDHDAFVAAAARLAMPLIAERDKLAAELATTKADLANERAVRSRRELAVARAIAKAKPYLHPGTNAGTHGVLSEMVEILEGKEW